MAALYSVWKAWVYRTLDDQWYWLRGEAGRRVGLLGMGISKVNDGCPCGAVYIDILPTQSVHLTTKRKRNIKEKRKEGKRKPSNLKQENLASVVHKQDGMTSIAWWVIEIGENDILDHQYLANFENIVQLLPTEYTSNWQYPQLYCLFVYLSTLLTHHYLERYYLLDPITIPFTYKHRILWVRFKSGEDITAYGSF